MRQRWVYCPKHPKANERGFVAWADYDGWTEKMALHSGVLSGRFYENVAATDGTDIGSRRKHQEYMKRNGLTVADDFKGSWDKAAKERESIRDGTVDRRERREMVERAIYQHYKP